MISSMPGYTLEWGCLSRSRSMVSTLCASSALNICTLRYILGETESPLAYLMSADASTNLSNSQSLFKSHSS